MNKRFKASYTVEAALIFPFIMGVMVFIIYISFYLHDRAVMKSCAYQAALKGSLIRSSTSAMENEARKAAEYNIEGLLLATDGLSTEIRISGKEITVSYSGSLRIPQGILFMKLSGTESMEVRGEARASQKDAIEFIRKTRSLKYLANSAVSVKEGD
ncbi:MAG: pilus assembly protein [Lachnospiraceae bacterium]|nr:pilus assembly protein [Lachnospiraceae bacterium]